MGKIAIHRPLALVALVLASSGCAMLGGNVKGSFSCKAPAGDCAPTSVIDERATRAAIAETVTTLAEHRVDPRPNADRLKVVLAAFRDAQGRTHEARVVEVPLPDPIGNHFKDPASRREVARALGRAAAAARLPQDPVPPAPDPVPTISALPDVLTAPSQHAPAGGPGSSLSPSRVPHLDQPAEVPAATKVVKP
jgi:conjugal transfer pilus assembly protein TraV